MIKNYRSFFKFPVVYAINWISAQRKLNSVEFSWGYVHVKTKRKNKKSEKLYKKKNNKRMNVWVKIHGSIGDFLGTVNYLWLDMEKKEREDRKENK